MKPERLNPETHRLSSLPSPKHPSHCQSCSRTTGLTRWQECDHNDKPENIIVVLCSECSKRVIEPHPRLYGKLHPNHPHPGSMEVCIDCVWRFGTNCSCPKAKTNGGPGVLLDCGQPTHAFVDGIVNGKRTGWRETWYPKPVSKCSERATA